MLKIGEFSRLSNITVRMLRHYDEIGLLTPSTIDKHTSYRYYSAKQLIKASKIQALKLLGFSLNVIKEILVSDNDRELIDKYFKMREIELLEEREKITKQVNLFKQISERIDESMDALKYNVVLKNIPQRNVVSYRKIINAYQNEGELWGKLYSEIGKNNIKVLNDGYSMSIFHDEEYKENDVDVEVQVSVSEEYKDLQEIKYQTVKQMQVASITFHGSYEQMPAVAKTIGEWLEQNAYQIDGQMLNIYHVSPAQTPNSDDWITEACYVVKKI